jgi:hypothetical protein
MKKITRQNRKNKIRKLSEQLNQILEQLNAVNLFEICIIDTYIMIIFVELIVLCLVYCLFNTYLFKIGHTCTYYKHCALYCWLSDFLPLFPTFPGNILNKSIYLRKRLRNVPVGDIIYLIYCEI